MEQALAGSPKRVRDTAGGELHPALRISGVFLSLRRGLVNAAGSGSAMFGSARCGAAGSGSAMFGSARDGRDHV